MPMCAFQHYFMHYVTPPFPHLYPHPHTPTHTHMHIPHLHPHIHPHTHTPHTCTSHIHTPHLHPLPTHTYTHTVIFLAIGIGVFVGIDQDYAGFFSLEGEPTDGCLSWGFGIALAAFIINIIATIVGVVAIFYRQIRRYQKAKFQY